MSAMQIVEALDVIEHVGPRRVPCAIDASVHTPSLQGAEEAFHRGIVPTITTTTHAAGNALLPE